MGGATLGFSKGKCPFLGYQGEVTHQAFKMQTVPDAERFRSGALGLAMVGMHSAETGRLS